jgi:hypothetical protein
MFDPSQVTLGQLSSAVRDWAIIGTLAVAVWKARGFYASGVDFFDRIDTHMTRMEMFANKALNNHLSHIEHDLRVLSGRRGDIIENDDSIGSTDMPGAGID